MFIKSAGEEYQGVKNITWKRGKGKQYPLHFNFVVVVKWEKGKDHRGEENED